MVSKDTEVVISRARQTFVKKVLVDSFEVNRRMSIGGAYADKERDSDGMLYLIV